MEATTFLAGQFLLAMPGIGDRRFEQAVIAMCSHDENGAMGIGVGATVDGLTLHDVLRQVDIDPGVAPAAPIHLGGPVEQRRGFVLHSNDWGGADTLDVAGRWSLSGTLDALRAIAAGTGPSRWIVALGYAGWAAGQLDGEMTRHGWLNISDDAAMLFDTPATRRWSRGFARVGVDPRLLVPQSGRA